MHGISAGVGSLFVCLFVYFALGWGFLHYIYFYYYVK